MTHRNSRRRAARVFRRGPRISDLMTRDYHAFVDSAIAAERAGDAETALEYHRGVPMFRRSAHAVLLRYLAGLADEMTPWLWARWAAYQCTRAEDGGTTSGDISRAALDYTVHVFYADLLQQAYDNGDDPVRITALTMGQDWVYHQLCTFELGGLEAFVDDLATGRLAEHAAELARRWGPTCMGGYRVEPDTGGALVVRDLADGQTHELLDLGARTHADAAGWLIGRLVPSGVSPAWMFDTRPLPVDERTARETASGEGPGAWVTALDDAIRAGRVDRALLRSEDRELATDVAGLALLARATDPAKVAYTLDRLGNGHDEIGRAAERLLQSAADGALDPYADAAYLGAALVNPHGWTEAQRRLVGPDLAATWESWAARLPDPASGRLLRLAEGVTSSS